MGWILPLIASFLGIIGLTGSIIFGVKINKNISKYNMLPNAPMIDVTTRRQFTNGYTEGIVKTQLPRKNGTIYYEFYPTDVEQGENVEKPEIQRVVIKKELKKVIPRGEGSSRREKIIVNSRDIRELPEQMRDTDKGKWMHKEGQLAHIEGVFGEAIRSGDEAIAEAMRMYARGNISRNALAQVRESSSEVGKLNINQEKPEEKK
jgi:hypothetical protein